MALSKTTGERRSRTKNPATFAAGFLGDVAAVLTAQPGYNV